LKDVGIVGLPYSGKSTLFAALTRSGAAGGRAHQAVVEVPDERLEVLARIERSRRVVPAKVRFVDVPGGLSAQALGHHRQADALCVVVRAHGDGDPAGELANVRAELLLNDLATVESVLAKAAKAGKAARTAKGGGAPPGQLETIRRAFELLDAEVPLVDAGLDERARAQLAGFGLLTLKPSVVVANVAEGATAADGLPEGAIAISAALEAEVAGMGAEEAAELLAGFGVPEPGLSRVVSACYRALDLVTFLTTGEDETRAWEVPRGATAPRAAGVIHSDLERGFIRAEVVTYDDLVEAGSWDAAKAAGRMRVEGKDYVVKEGDVLHIRFAV
jgi:GTP-binding protein YchF